MASETKQQPRRLELGHILGLLSILPEAVERMGLTQEQIRDRFERAPDANVVSIAMDLANDVLKVALKDYDRKAKQPGPFLAEVLEAFGDAIGLTLADMMAMAVEDILGEFEGLLKAEANGRLGKLFSNMIRPITTLFSQATEIVLTKIRMALLASAGGQYSGGTTPLSIELEAGMEEASDQSTDFPSGEYSPSSPQPDEAANSKQPTNGDPSSEASNEVTEQTPDNSTP